MSTTKLNKTLNNRKETPEIPRNRQAIAYPFGILNEDPNGEEYAFNTHRCCDKLAGNFIYADDLDKDSFWEEINNEVFNSDRIRKKLVKAVMEEYDINSEEIEVDDDD